MVGIRDKTLSQRLQMESDLTLGKAKRLIRQKEAVREQESVLKHLKEAESTLDSVAPRGGRRCSSK